MSDLDWASMPYWVMFTATNMTGQINGYEEEPIYSHGTWGSSCMRFCHITTVKPPDKPGKTLIKRPIKKEELAVSEHKPLGFKKTLTGWYSIINRHGDHCGFITQDVKGDYLFHGFTSDRLLEIAVKVEELSNAKAHTERASQEQSQSSS